MKELLEFTMSYEMFDVANIPAITYPCFNKCGSPSEFGLRGVLENPTAGPDPGNTGGGN